MKTAITEGERLIAAQIPNLGTEVTLPNNCSQWFR